MCFIGKKKWRPFGQLGAKIATNELKNIIFGSIISLLYILKQLFTPVSVDIYLSASRLGNLAPLATWPLRE